LLLLLLLPPCCPLHAVSPQLCLLLLFLLPPCCPLHVVPLLLCLLLCLLLLLLFLLLLLLFLLLQLLPRELRRQGGLQVLPPVLDCFTCSARRPALRPPRLAPPFPLRRVMQPCDKAAHERAAVGAAAPCAPQPHLRRPTRERGKAQ
jgi:hypothetical protein